MLAQTVVVAVREKEWQPIYIFFATTSVYIICPGTFAQTMKAPTWDVFAREALVLFEAAPDKVWRRKALSAMHGRMLIDCIRAMVTVLQVRYTARWSHSKGRLVLKVTDDKHVCARLHLHPVVRGIRSLLSDLLSTFSFSV